MRCLSFIIAFISGALISYAQSPHGKAFKLDCSKCHQTEDWKVIPSKTKFDHNVETNFKLIGQHQIIDCRSCHSNLIFSEVPTDCFSCHKDIHQNSVGMECSKCHSPETWIVKDFNQLHQNSRFPLLGAHLRADCIQCHTSYSSFNFEVLGVSCFDCHSNDYYATTTPNHASANFSTDCQDCHSIKGNVWAAETFIHDFFPLIGGHKIQNCFSCHQQGGNYKGLSTDCYSCHKQDYELEKDPDHLAGGFSTDCIQCHTIQGWSSATFDHNLASFSLTGAHVNISCASCHSNGFTGTPSNCYSCHQNTFNNAVNPNHISAGISTECQSCHNTSAWVPSNFAHSSTGFELIGKHTPLDCSSCHKGTTTGLNQACISCHQTDYSGAPNHASQNYPANCEMCHNPNGWEQANFNHQITAFPLTGAHTITECSACHQTGFTGTTTICADCHQSNYNATSNPNHAALSITVDCQTCHTANPGWKPAQFAIHNNYYELLGAHIQIANDCNTCHNGNYNTTPNTCFGCHATNYNNTTNPPHASTGFSTDCQPCHSQNGWSPATFDHDNQFFPIYSGKHNGKWNVCSDCHTSQSNYSVFSCIDCHEHNKQDTDDEHREVSGYVYASDQCFACHPRGDTEGSFDHSLSNFPLTGSHISVSCAQCHQNGYSGTSTACIDCHSSKYASSTNPNHQALGLSTDCSSCHSTNPEWQPASFPQHAQFFQLTGKHAEISNNCISCHNGNYNTITNQCVGCHQNNIPQDHIASGINSECQTCHNSITWQSPTFVHTSTGFELTGRHASVLCSSCHVGTTSGLSGNCVSCHQANFNIAPNHTAQSYPINCEMCHNSVAWNQTSFDHQATTFPLTGAHTSVNCTNCHQSGFTGTPANCYACHDNNYGSTVNPNHTAAGISTECQSCHNTTLWNPSTFSHTSTGFTLTGQHASIQCSSCHQGNTTGANSNCISCHQSNYNTAPGHTAQNYPTSCAMCHNTMAWNQTSFDHQTTTFPLTGVHTSVNCSNCHQSGFTGTPANCYACHDDTYGSTTNPNHVVAGISAECQTCHNTSAWIPSSFDHSGTGFTLTGQHSAIQCSSCHSGSTGGLNEACISCHQSNYNIASNHTAQNYPTSCEMCHNSIAWNQTSFDHQATNFPLTGAHVNSNCSNCHQSGFTGTTTVCADCHQSDYNASTNPSHTALALSTSCQSCHTTNQNWQPATFSIHNNYYQLLGAHSNIQNDCATCHNGNYNTTPNTCYGCHESNYISTTNPPHQSAGFSTDCQTCHSQNGWTPATFDHDNQFFPIYSGKHREKWDACSDCHTNPGNYSIFSCLNCHEHNQTSMDDKHSDVNGYVYQSSACLSCHPNGDEDRVMKRLEIRRD